MWVKIHRLVLVLTIVFVPYVPAAGADSITIHMYGHASLCFEYNTTVIHVDPYATQTDYSSQPDADILLITHSHSDHYNTSAIKEIQKSSTVMICPSDVEKLGTFTGRIQVLANGSDTTLRDVLIRAVPAYNTSNNNHPQGVGNGYVITLGAQRIYIAGDTELIPAMDSLGVVDIAFIPMNLPYTMSVAMAAEAAKKINPAILYIYHFSNSDTAAVRTLLSGEDMEVRIGPSVFRESAGSTVAVQRESWHPAVVRRREQVSGSGRNGAASVDLSGRNRAYADSFHEGMVAPSTGSGVMVIRSADGRAQRVVRVR